MTPTPEQLAMARRIAADQIIRMDDSQRGHNAAAAVLSGECDEFSLTVQAALAAIIETTEAAAKLADDRHAAWVAIRLRADEHLKGRT